MRNEKLITVANEIRKYIKAIKIQNVRTDLKYVTVKVSKDTLIIDNLNYISAATFAEIVTGEKFEYITLSMAKLKS